MVLNAIASYTGKLLILCHVNFKSIGKRDVSNMYFLTSMERHVEGETYFLSSPTIRCRRVHLRGKGGRKAGKGKGGVRFPLVSGLFPSSPSHSNFPNT